MYRRYINLLRVFLYWRSHDMAQASITTRRKMNGLLSSVDRQFLVATFSTNEYQRSLLLLSLLSILCRLYILSWASSSFLRVGLAVEAFADRIEPRF